MVRPVRAVLPHLHEVRAVILLTIALRHALDGLETRMNETKGAVVSAPRTEAADPRLTELTERHHPGPHAYGTDYCDMDGTPWPCDVAKALALLPARTATTEARCYCGHTFDGECDAYYRAAFEEANELLGEARAATTEAEALAAIKALVKAIRKAEPFADRDPILGPAIAAALAAIEEER